MFFAKIFIPIGSVMCCASTRERDEVRGVLQTKVRERERARVKFFCHWGAKELSMLKRSESSDLPAQSEVADRLEEEFSLEKKRNPRGQ